MKNYYEDPVMDVLVISDQISSSINPDDEVLGPPSGGGGIL